MTAAAIGKIARNVSLPIAFACSDEISHESRSDDEKESGGYVGSKAYHRQLIVTGGGLSSVSAIFFRFALIVPSSPRFAWTICLL